MRRWQKRIQTNPYLLNPEELMALCASDFPLIEVDATWIDRYLELFAFARKYGHGKVSSRSSSLAIGSPFNAGHARKAL